MYSPSLHFRKLLPLATPHKNAQMPFTCHKCKTTGNITKTLRVITPINVRRIIKINTKNWKSLHLCCFESLIIDMSEAPVYRVVICKRGAIIPICLHLYFQTRMIVKDNRVRNMKYVQYNGHIQYLHDSARRVKCRRLVHNATGHYHRLMSVTAGLVLFDILPWGL
jgi:hypothetical protein